MGGVAVLAKQAGHQVSGSDANVYPPMSVQLEQLGIRLCQGYSPDHIQPPPDQVVVGNVMTRGNSAVEYVLNQGLSYVSGPQWLAENVLKDRWVLAVAGTHGKTTTSSMLAWILEYAGLNPGFLIGGVPGNFGISARLGGGPFFVVEADEYDTAFFDKRSKFVHYRPRTLVMNNLEYDHADIFPDLAAIQKQFHHLVRTVPGEGLMVVNGNDEPLKQVLQNGCWTPVEYFDSATTIEGWSQTSLTSDGRCFEVLYNGEVQGVLEWFLPGEYNRCNALAAIAAARHVGVPPAQSIEALKRFKGVKRRMEMRGEVGGITVYDDFAHHPTAIAATLQGLRKAVGGARIYAVLEPRSNTMRMGVHKDRLGEALKLADEVLLFQPPELDWCLDEVTELFSGHARVFDRVDDMVDDLSRRLASGDQVVIMSNGGFGGIHEKLLDALNSIHGESTIRK